MVDRMGVRNTMNREQNQHPDSVLIENLNRDEKRNQIAQRKT